jgi:hypothetical protein
VLEETVDVGLHGEIGLNDRGAAELLRECSRPLLAAVVMNEHPRALGGKRPCARGADASGCPGDQHALALEPRVDAA